MFRTPLPTFSLSCKWIRQDGTKAQDLVVPENVRLIYQPAYSPEVNPVEHVWEELREKYFPNRVFPSLDLVLDMLCQGITDLAAHPERLRSMTCFPHFRIDV